MLGRSHFDSGGGQLHGRILHGFGHISNLLAKVLDIPEVNAVPGAADLAELLDPEPADPDAGYLS